MLWSRFAAGAKEGNVKRRRDKEKERKGKEKARKLKGTVK